MSIAALQQSLNNTKVLSDYIRLTGGVDEVTPPYERKPGVARLAQNFESVLRGGYRRISGYERTDGRPSPSEASYSIIAASIFGSIAVSDAITGGTSSATAVVAYLVSNFLVLTKVSGAFQNDEALTVSGNHVATTTSVASAESAATPLLHATYRNAAADIYRSDIAAVPGQGNILGVIEFNDIKYAFRNAIGGSTAAMYKSSGAGWTLVALGRQLSFTSGGTTEIVVGNTITGATSAATAVVTRVVLKSGTWAGGDAAGKITFASQTGTFQAENLDIGASANVATIAGNSTAITLLPGGRYEFDIQNFGGAVATKRIYGCDGINKGFEFDGTVYVPIDTGMAADAPTHVKCHKKQLFYSFGASVQHSAPGTPYIWSAVLGASELGVGDNVTGFGSQTGSADGGAIVIFSRNQAHVLYGSGVSDWNLVPLRREVGGYSYTIQDTGAVMFLDDRGVTTMQSVQSYGNFAHSAITDQVRDTMNALRTTAVASCVCRDKGQYRLFFQSGYAFFITFLGTVNAYGLSGNSVIGIMPILFPDPVTCTWSGERNNGAEAMYFGSSNGMVYQMDKGTSFDGSAIEAFITLSWDFQKSPRQNKRYRDATLELDGGGYAEFSIGYALGYGSTNVPQQNAETIVSNFSRSFWDQFVWDRFRWDGVTLTPSSIYMDGESENISIGVTSISDMFEPFTITAALVNYTPRGRLRP